MGKKMIQNHSPVGKASVTDVSPRCLNSLCLIGYKRFIHWTMVLNHFFTHLTPEDGCEVQQLKRSDIPSQQDEDKSPKTLLHNTIPSSKNLRQKFMHCSMSV